MSKQIAIQNKKLISDIKKTWESALIDSKSAMKKAILTGELLTKLKENTPHGQWENILKANFEFAFGTRQAQKLMAISANKELIKISSGGDIFTIDGMTKLISDATPEQLEKAERLKAEEVQKRMQAEAEKAAKAEAKKQPEIIEGEFTEVAPVKSAPKPEPKKEEVQPGFVQVKPEYIENLEEGLHEAHSLSKSIREDNDSMLKVFESDDRLKAAIEEAQKFREMNRILNERINGLMNEKNAAIQTAKSWQRKVEKLEKELKALKGGSNE